jgi:hypothetical protein
MNFLRKLLPDPFDALHIFGLGAVVWGVWQIHHGAAWIVGGLAAVSYSLLVSAGRRHREL